nr:hypothetical protein [Blautia sp. LMAG:89]
MGLKDTVISNLKNLPKKPDIVLKKYKISVFLMESFSMERIGRF